MGRSPCWAPRSSILTLGTSQTRTEESYKKARYWKRKNTTQGCENQHNYTKKAKLRSINSYYDIHFPVLPTHDSRQCYKAGGAVNRAGPAAVMIWATGRLPPWAAGKFSQSSERKINPWFAQWALRIHVPLGRMPDTEPEDTGFGSSLDPYQL